MTDPNDDDLVITVLSSSTGREELLEAIELVSREAHREQHIVGTPAFPTRWDRLHEFLDSLLDELAGR